MIKKLILTLAGVLLIYASTFISITPVQGSVPITGQSFMVLLVAFLGGLTWGFPAVVIYLLLGGLGLSVFANGASGWAEFTDNGGGFLWGFAVAALFVGLLKLVAGSDNLSLFKVTAFMLLGTIVLLACGFFQLSVLLQSAELGWQYGVQPYLPGAVVKILFGGFLGWYLQRWV